MVPKIFAAFIIVISIFFLGCISENTPFKSKDTVFDLKPSEVTIKNGETAYIKIRIANNGKSIIHPVVRFNMNYSDKPYVNFSPESYDLGNLRPGEDSGFRIVNIKASLAAGTEVKYPVRAEVINDGAVLDRRDFFITVRR